MRTDRSSESLAGIAIAFVVVGGIYLFLKLSGELPSRHFIYWPFNKIDQFFMWIFQLLVDGFDFFVDLIPMLTMIVTIWAGVNFLIVRLKNTLLIDTNKTKAKLFEWSHEKDKKIQEIENVINQLKKELGGISFDVETFKKSTAVAQQQTVKNFV